MEHNIIESVLIGLSVFIILSWGYLSGYRDGKRQGRQEAERDLLIGPKQ